MRTKHFWGVLVFCLAVSTFLAQESQKPEEKPGAAAGTPPPPHVFTISPEDKARKNPIKFTQVSVERGKKRYLTQCAMCHGKEGDGKGELAEEMKIAPPAFTKAETLKDRTDGELFAIITAGSETMPGQGTRLTDLHKWQIVNFLRSLSGRTPEKTSEKEPEENVITVPQ